MKVTQEKLPASQIGLEIEITPEMSKQAYEKTLQEFTRSANIPGFRKGKIPRQILIQQFGSTRIKRAVLEELIESSFQTAVQQEKIEAIGNFALKSSFEDLVSQFEPGGTLTFSATVDVSPVANLTQYQGFTIQAEEIAYDPAQVDEILEDYRKQSATLVPVEARSAIAGDIAVVDFVGRLSQADEASGEAEEIPGASATDFEIELEEGRFIAGFIDGIIGMTPGEEKEVNVTFPEDYTQADLAGKPAVFTITLKELKEQELPELDDDFAQEVSRFETLAALRESLETRFQKEAEQQTKVNREQALLNELVQHLEVELPETLIRQEVDHLITQTAMRLGDQGIDIKKVFTADLVQRLREQSRSEAIARLHHTLVLGEIAKKESITVSQEEINTRVREFLNSYQGKDVDIGRLREMVEEDLMQGKIFEWLAQNNTIEMVPEGSLKPAEAALADDSSSPIEVAPSESAPSEATEVEEVPVPAEMVTANVEPKSEELVAAPEEPTA